MRIKIRKGFYKHITVVGAYILYDTKYGKKALLTNIIIYGIL